MRRLRRCAGLLGLVVATACGRPGAAPDTTLTAAGAEAAAAVAPSSSTTTAVPVTAAPTTTTVRRTAPPPAPTTTIARTPPPAVLGAPTTTLLAGPGMLVAPETVQVVATNVTDRSTTVNMQAVREQYLGEKVYVTVAATSMERIVSIRIDFGDGYATTDPQPLPSTLLTVGAMPASATRAHVYPAPGHYRITVTLTVVPGVAAPLPPPSPPTEIQWIPSGPEHAVTLAADLRQRPDAAPPGYPRLPPLASE